MPSGERALERYLRSTRVRVLVAGVIALSLLIVVRLGRYPEWDEAVFLSQSGGLEGLDSRPSHLAPSRELGAAVLLKVLRLLNSSLANTRLLWLALSVTVLLIGITWLGRHLRVSTAAIAAIFGTYWLTPVFAGSFFAFFPGTAFVVVAAAAYLALREDRSRQLLWGSVLGMSIAAGMWLRQVEGALVLAGMLGHAVLITPRAFWTRRLRGIGVATMTFTLTFIVPWIVDSTLRFGSVAERISRARAQSFERGLTNQLPNYFDTLRGRSQIYGSIGSPPDWAIGVVTTVLVLGVVVVVVSIIMRIWRLSTRVVSQDGVESGGLTLVWLLGLGLIAFFAFFIGEVSDRYMVMGIAFASAAIITTTVRLSDFLVARNGPSKRDVSRPLLVAMTFGFALWFGANLAIANTYESARFDAGQVTRGHVETIRALAEGRPCAGVSRFGAPQIQFGTGCMVRRAFDPVEAASILLSQQDPETFTFVLWPERTASELRLPDHYRSLVRHNIEGQGTMILLFTTVTEA